MKNFIRKRKDYFLIAFISLTINLVGIEIKAQSSSSNLNIGVDIASRYSK